MTTPPLADVLQSMSTAIGVTAMAASDPEVRRRRLERSDELFASSVEVFAPLTGKSAHDPVVSAEGDWPGCTGELRRYPSGVAACDCGEAAREALEVRS